MSVGFSEEALEDLEAAVDYLLERNAPAAERLVNRVFELAERLAAREFEGPEQVLSNGEVVRSWPIHPYRLYYLRHGESLYIVRIYHHSRRPL